MHRAARGRVEDRVLARQLVAERDRVLGGIVRGAELQVERRGRERHRRAVDQRMSVQRHAHDRRRCRLRAEEPAGRGAQPDQTIGCRDPDGAVGILVETVLVDVVPWHAVVGGHAHPTRAVADEETVPGAGPDVAVMIDQHRHHGADRIGRRFDRPAADEVVACEIEAHQAALAGDPDRPVRSPRHGRDTEILGGQRARDRDVHAAGVTMPKLAGKHVEHAAAPVRQHGGGRTRRRDPLETGADARLIDAAIETVLGRDPGDAVAGQEDDVDRRQTDQFVDRAVRVQDLEPFVGVRAPDPAAASDREREARPRHRVADREIVPLSPHRHEARVSGNPERPVGGLLRLPDQSRGQAGGGRQRIPPSEPKAAVEAMPEHLQPELAGTVRGGRDDDAGRDAVRRREDVPSVRPEHDEAGCALGRQRAVGRSEQLQIGLIVAVKAALVGK